MVADIAAGSVRSHRYITVLAAGAKIKLREAPKGVDTDESTPSEGLPLITLQRRQLVGHDILLARHGNHISSMRVDRSNGRVVALLDDGTLDSAPNLIAPGLELPQTVRSVLREDWKLLGAWAGMAALMGGLMTAAAVVLGTTADPALLEALTAYSAY